MSFFSGLFGKTRQAYYKQINKDISDSFEQEIVLEMIRKVKEKAKTKRWGVRKIQLLIKDDLEKHSIKMGRDKLFDLLRDNQMLVKPRKRNFFTTQSHHWLRKYDYLLANKVLTAKNQLWVADITYIYSNQEPLYLHLITDAYSQKIVGWCISKDLKAQSSIVALKMALKYNPDINKNQLIHHSDRGVQYCSEQYVEHLQNNQIAISMTEPKSPHQNSIAERVNGILKNEWIDDLELTNLKDAKAKIKAIIQIYNEFRPHQSLNNMTPNQIHDKGFIRHKAKRELGNMYPRKKVGLHLVQP